jgi:DtxR family Mn-dependent transcriptional regulator
MSAAVEDYLKVIYTLQSEQGKVATKALALRLGVAPASVSGMLGKLDNLGYLYYRRYKGAVLTPSGQQRALQVIRRHRLAELWLREVLGMPLHQVHDEAHKWEHVLSDEVERRLDELLDHPDRDPHGTPIPTAEGYLAGDIGIPLAKVPVAKSVVICEVNDHDPALVRYLEERGLLPGARVEILDRQPFEGPVTLRVADQEHVVGTNITQHIYVETDQRPSTTGHETSGKGRSTSREKS